ncbi:Protein CBG22158 [Caenorhabditis briggsae]|uniref:Protein AATF n=2 Tax=Caenorhabditis briggsae TaxID=6238 RepID=A0AAE9IX31_CAEBR|nr:Protein CBG22158 [Caenorhabditis briggsae]ULU09705.1 hypothetical protein L3Y34_014233 [Caenorhabditis briggsae]CAP38810.2 Protein CBG22158 [Caenorhabditis briggsae]
MGLLDDISKLTQPAAELPDVEDDFDASSLVKPTGNRAKNKLQNFNFDEGKYAGVAVSSKDIFGDVSEISGLKAKDSESEDDLDDEAEDEEDFEEESDVEMEEDVGEKKKKSNILENLADSDEDEEMNDEEEEDGDSGDDEKEEEDDGDEEEGANLKMTTLSLRDDSDKTEKATSVLHQRQVWDDLSYSNIRIHALLNAMNQMPRGDARRELVKNCDPSTQKSMEAAMENMAKLRDLMAKAGGFFEEKSGKTEDSDDEEIPSDDEEILSDSEGLDDEEEEEEDEAPKKKAENQGTSLKSLKKNLETLDGSIDKFRAATLTKWYNRTKVLSSKSMNNADFSVFEKGSILGQINKVLADEDKLLKKVHTNRSGKTRLGASASSDSHDPEIFDDSDFYQVLLKQMLEARSQMNQNSQDGADMTRNYMELQSMISNKKKRDVSQLSSKDRKLKYEPIAKLINFYPSKPSVATWSHESRNELFKSLFS